MEACSSAAAQPGFAIAIVRGALLRIAQHVVRFRDLLELLFGLFRPVVAVGVILHRELAIRLLDVVVRRTARHAKNVIKVSHAAFLNGYCWRRSLSSRDVWLTSEITFS